jgi:hypothetical protein
MLADLASPSLRATGSGECPPDDRLREAIHLPAGIDGLLRRFAALRKRFAFVAGNDGGVSSRPYCFTLLASILIEVSSILTENAVFTSNGFSMPR